MALAGGVLSLGLVSVTATDAHADAGDVINTVEGLAASAGTVGESLALPAAEEAGAATALAGCIGTIACGALVGAVALVGTAPIWFPAVKGMFTGGFNASSASGSITVLGPDATGQGLNLFYSVQNVQWLDSAAGWLGRGSDYYACKTTATGVVTVNQTYRWLGPSLQTIRTTPGTSTPYNVNGQIDTGAICGSGTTLVGIHTEAGDASGDIWSVLDWGSSVPSNLLSQKVTTTCTKPDGSTGTVTASTSGVDGQIVVPSCQQAFGAGSWPSGGYTLKAGFPGAETTQQTVGPAPSTFKTNYPNCFSASGALVTGANACRVRVWINGNPCHVGVAGCATWPTDAADNGDTVECRWGTYVVSLSDCNLLKKAYQSGTGTQTISALNPNNGTAYDPVIDPGQAPSPTPQPQPQSAPTAGSNPSSTPTPFDPTAPNPQPEGQNCWGSGWSWNPISWVYVPVKCSLSWAFVPPSWPSWPSFPWTAPNVPHFTDDCPSMSLDLGNNSGGAHPLAICDQIKSFLARPLFGNVTPPTLVGGMLTFFFAVRLLEMFTGAVGKGTEE